MHERRSDSELVAAHLGGDRSALAAIYDRYADPLYDTAAAMLSDRHDAEDLTHDVFVVAARRLDQLRDPERLRPWLFSILRHEVYRRSKRRRTIRPTDLTDSGVGDVSAPLDPLAEAGGVEAAELAEFVRAAARGLAERDQLLLELSVRQGLSGADLADAVGVTAQQCHVLVHRMRERVQRSIGALAVARYGRSACPELQVMLRGWDGTFDPPTRKRIAGHVDSCDTCEDTRRRYAVIPLLSAAPALAAPPSLRDRVLGGAAPAPAAGAGPTVPFDARGFPTAPGAGRRIPLVAAALIAVLLVLGGGWLAIARSGDDTDGGRAAPATAPTPPAPAPSTVAVTTPRTAPSTTAMPSVTTVATVPTTPAPTTAPATTQPPTTPPATTLPATTATDAPTAVDPTNPPPAPPPAPRAPPPTPAPGALVLSATTIDLGPTSTNASVSLANTGGRPIDWSISGDAAPFIVGSPGGTLAPGATIDVPIGVDRGGLAEGDLSRQLAVVSSSGVGSTALTLLASVERPPEVSITVAPSFVSCPIGIGQPVQAAVVDESAMAAVTLTWTGPGDPGSAAMALRSGSWFARLTPAAVNGSWTLTVTATDTRGNTASASRPFVVGGC